MEKLVDANVVEEVLQVGHETQARSAVGFVTGVAVGVIGHIVIPKVVRGIGSTLRNARERRAMRKEARQQARSVE